MKMTTRSSQFFTAYGRFVGFHPWVALAMVLVLTVIAVIGFTLIPPQADESDAFLPDNSELIAANENLEASFPESSALESVQIVLRGNVLTPAGAADSIRATLAAAEDADLAPYVVAGRQPISPGGLLRAILAGPGGDPAAVDIGSVSQAEIDAALADPMPGPGIAQQIQMLDSLVARDDSGAVVGGIGVVTVNSNDDPDGLAKAQVAVDDRVEDVPLAELDSARTLSSGKSDKESDDAATSALALLMLLALLVIALLLALFYRQLSDVLLSLGGLILTIVWALGFQGIVGPDGLGLIGAPSVLGQMIPVIVIGLCVDYGIQYTSRYREACVEQEDASEGISEAVAAVILPLGLAAVTTIISFLTNIFGDISGLADFGVMASLGVASGLFVFLTGVPAVRVLLDRRAQAKGKQLTVKPMADAIPGAGALVEKIGAATVRRPVYILVLTGIVTVVLGTAALGLESSFNSNDFLSDGTESKEDVEFLDEFLGGNTEPVTVLIEADVANDRTLRNLLDFSAAIQDPTQQPEAVTGGVTASLGVVFNDLPAETRQEALTIVQQASLSNPLVLEEMSLQEALDLIREADPTGFDAVVTYGEGDETDRTILQFDALTGDADRTRQLFADVDGLWFGEDEEITPIANEIISLEVTDSLTDSQSASIMLTLLAALVVLVLFFWVTEFRPMLAVLSTFPILLVLIWVLGTMSLLGIDYNVVTALITALSIGIGVDYTIHITHRFLEEREGQSLREAVSATMRTTGGALIGSALTTALGFLMLTFSPIGPLGQFGLLTAITVCYSLVAAILVLPPMLVMWAAYHDWRAQSPV